MKKNKKIILPDEFINLKQGDIIEYYNSVFIYRAIFLKFRSETDMEYSNIQIKGKHADVFILKHMSGGDFFKAAPLIITEGSKNSKFKNATYYLLTP